MSKEQIAVDIVILPPKEIGEQAIAFSKKLAQENNAIELNYYDTLPHLTLAMACIEKDKLSQCIASLEQLLEQHSKTELQVDGTFSETGVMGFAVAPEQRLQKLHNDVADLLKEFRTETKDLAAFAGDLPSDFTPAYLDAFLDKVSYENYFPHITCGFGDMDYDSPQTSFTAERIAICQLGKYTTCHTILWETKLV